MLEMGGSDEVEQLLRTVPARRARLERHRLPLDSLGRHKGVFARGCAGRVRIDTRQYAKRQRTWFRHQLPAASVTRIDPGAPDALERAMSWWTATDDGGVLA